MESFKITNLEQRKVNTKYGEKTVFTFTNEIDNIAYDVWEKKGFTDLFSDGYEFSGYIKPNPNPKYKPNVTQDPPNVNYSGDRVSYNTTSLDLTEVHAKLDRILTLLGRPQEVKEEDVPF